MTWHQELLAGALIVIAASALGFSQEMKHEEREMRVAEQAILASLAVASSPQGRYLCSQNELACAGPDKGELGLAVIGARTNEASADALAALMRYRLDAGLAEEYQCYILAGGKSTRNRLLALDLSQLERQCHSELAQLIKGKNQFEGLNETSICRDTNSMRQQVKGLVEAINRGRKCGADDF